MNTGTHFFVGQENTKQPKELIKQQGEKVIKNIADILAKSLYGNNITKGGIILQVAFSTKLPHELAIKLDQHAKATGESKAAIVAAALEAYLKTK